MELRVVHPAGLDYLRLVTQMLQAQRLEAPRAGVWEAADLQWWWRKDQHGDSDRQAFWMGGDTPVAAVIMSDWGVRLSCDLLLPPTTRSEYLELVWPEAARMIEDAGAIAVEMLVDDGDRVVRDRIEGAGFGPTAGRDLTLWMAADDRPAPRPLPPGFTLTSRAVRTGGAHPMQARSGADVADRLRQCSLYDPALDLAVYGPDDELAAYGLFWADPVTGVGLVEPMRTEAAFQRRGLAAAVLTRGLEGLAGRRCRWLKVSCQLDNPASCPLYQGLGFLPAGRCTTYQKRPMRLP
jgi:GNAT superfamily N-acetyltransferase